VSYPPPAISAERRARGFAEDKHPQVVRLKLNLSLGKRSSGSARDTRQMPSLHGDTIPPHSSFYFPPEIAAEGRQSVSGRTVIFSPRE